MPESLSFEAITLNIETLIFSSETGIGKEEIRQVLQQAFEQQINDEAIEKSISAIKEKYNQNFAIEVAEINAGYQFLTKKTFHPIVNQLQIQRSKKKLSQAALETLAIIAYRQPITKLEIEQVRGVNCDYTVQKLLEKELIAIAGKSETVGRPLLYCTSSLFMDYFGINDKSELPKLNEISPDENQTGETNQ